MVAVHQRQLLSWEEDRQKVLTLEERCSKLEGQNRVPLLCIGLCAHTFIKGARKEVRKEEVKNAAPDVVEFCPVEDGRTL
jgi:hypothetical protein